MTNRLIAALFALLWVTAAHAYPAPQPLGRVNDFAGVISEADRTRINAIIEETERVTGAEIAVLTVDSIAPLDETAYARLIFDTWKIGKKGKDNGVLLLLAVQDRLWRIETGYGLEGILPDGVCGELGRTYLVPQFKAGRYGEGFYLATAAIANRIAAAENLELTGVPVPRGAAGAGTEAGLLVFLFFFFLVWNLPWPVVIGLPVTTLFAAALSKSSPLAGFVVAAAYLCSMGLRYAVWRKIPPAKRKSFFGPNAMGGSGGHGAGGWSSGGSGGGGFSGGSFGGGGGGGGGAGGRF